MQRAERKGCNRGWENSKGVTAPLAEMDRKIKGGNIKKHRIVWLSGTAEIMAQSLLKMST